MIKLCYQGKSCGHHEDRYRHFSFYSQIFMGRLHSTPLVISTILTGSFLLWATESIPTVFSFQGSQYGAVADMWLINCSLVWNLRGYGRRYYTDRKLVTIDFCAILYGALFTYLLLVSFLLISKIRDHLRLHKETIEF